MRLVLTILLPQVAAYLIVTFIMWDWAWFTSLPRLSVGDRGAILLVWVFATGMISGTYHNAISRDD